MEDKSQKDVTPEELEKRLDDIFGGGDNETESSREESVLSNLDSLMLTLDWEISDETMSSFLSEVDSLKSSWSQDRLLGNFLKILHSLGKYIQKRKGQSHPEAITLLQSVYADLKSAVESTDLSRKQKKERLLKDIEQYNALKSKIAEQKSTRDLEPHTPSAKETPPDRQHGSEILDPESQETTQAEHDFGLQEQEEVSAESGANPDRTPDSAEKSVLEAVEELKEVIREEFRKLRNDLGVQHPRR